MEVSVRGRLAEAIRGSKDPVAAAKSILLDGYRKTEGVSDIRVDVTSRLEMARSIAVQAAYEAMGEREGWLEAGRIDLESEDANELRWYRMKDGVRFFLRNSAAGLDMSRLDELAALDEEAMTDRRFLGSYRQHVPGVGYAVSMRKRSMENQDSFHLAATTRGKVFGVADGVGSDRFSALASHLIMRELARRDQVMKEDIIQINDIVAARMNSADILKFQACGLGTSTLLVGFANGASKRVMKVGDSIGFASYEGVVEELAADRELKNVIGHSGLREEHIEYFGLGDGQIVLTSDGVTNYTSDTDYLIAKLTAMTGDAVLIAENLLRAVIANQTAWNHSDDVTIVVEERG